MRQDSNIGSVVRLENPLAKNLSWPAKGLYGPARQQRESVRVLPGERQVVDDRHHGKAFAGPQCVDDFHDIDGMTHIQIRRRLVEEQNRRLLGKGARQEHSLRLASGERGERSGSKGPEVHELERSAHRSNVTLPFASEVPEVRSPPQQDVVGDGHRLGHQWTLGHPRNVQARPRDRPRHGHRTVIGDQSHCGLEQRRLSRSVGSDDPQPLAVAGLERQRAQNASRSVAHRDVGPGDHAPLIDLRTRTKKGAPRKAVTTPIGSSAGAARLRAARSDPIRKAAPKSSDRGTITR